MSGDHRRNIEIKAEIADDKEFQRKVSIASKICDNETSDILNQRDVFFQVPNGRLKMRYEVRLTVKSDSNRLFLKSAISNRIKQR